MAIFTRMKYGSFSAESFQSYLDGPLSSVSGTEIVYYGRDTFSSKAVFTGTFETDLSGAVTGTITDFIFYFRSPSDTTYVTIDNANVSADRALSLIARDKFGELVAEFAKGDDLIDGQRTDQTYVVSELYGYDGNDTLLGGIRNDEMHGGSGRDEMRGGSGEDMLFGGGGSDLMFGDFDNDVLSGNGGGDIMDGGYGEDRLSGGGGRDKLFGGSENDELSGDAGHDRLSGQIGADTLDGGAGNDVLQGGRGADRFVFSKGHDTITDFKTGGRQEVVDLSATDISGFRDLKKAAMRDTSDGVLIEISQKDTLLLSGLDMDELKANDFLF